MNITVLLITILFFFDSIGYSVYEIKNNNKLGGISIIILSIIMIIFTNTAMIIYK